MIFLTVCTSAGRREVLSLTVKLEIDKALTETIEADKECVFYSDGTGDFDKKCESAMRGMRKKYPERSIRLVRVLLYLTHEIGRDEKYFEFYYNDTVVPMELMGVHYKATIKKWDRWMVDQADKILAYIYRDFGGTSDTIKYAYCMGKPVLNFAVKG